MVKYIFFNVQIIISQDSTSHASKHEKLKKKNFYYVDMEPVTPRFAQPLLYFEQEEVRNHRDPHPEKSLPWQKNSVVFYKLLLMCCLWFM